MNRLSYIAMVKHRRDIAPVLCLSGSGVRKLLSWIQVIQSFKVFKFCRSLIQTGAHPTKKTSSPPRVNHCKLREVTCGASNSSLCINRTAVCDGKVQCPNKDDERSGNTYQNQLKVLMKFALVEREIVRAF